MSSTTVPQNAIAVVGMAGRFPGADTPGELWELLKSGKETISFFEQSDLDPQVAEDVRNNPRYVAARGQISETELFDAAFFGMSPREASLIDPQQRLFLEISQHALEDASIDPHRFGGPIGVFGGTGANSYLTNNVLPDQSTIDLFGDHQIGLANGPDYIATRVSYKLGLTGPSIGVYTGCSLSLVAVCLACDSLLAYESDAALAGGTFVTCPPKSGYLYQEGEIMSKDGHCRPFDAQATGTVFSNGAGVVVLKRLEDAIEADDHVYAIIRGWALNNDGAVKASYTAPSVAGQADAIRQALANADINPSTVSYVETHGTGTPVGDPVEIEALTRAFQSELARSHRCLLGSIKANIGHLDAAAGVAGLIKVCLMLHHDKIPASINFTVPNPSIDFENSPFEVNTVLRSWPEGGTPPRAGVTSLGVGGTNAHVVLEQAATRERRPNADQWQLLPISASSSDSREAFALDLAAYIKHYSAKDLADVAFSLQTGRRHFTHRGILAARDPKQASTMLQGETPGFVTTKVSNPCSKVAFMFSGQGTQYATMTKGLYEDCAPFRDSLDECLSILKETCSIDLRSLLFPITEAGIKDANSQLRQTSNTQPALFSVEYSLARQWKAWGIEPSVMAGHSIGEYVAACLANVFTLKDALRLAIERGRLMQSMPPGSMVAVSKSEQEVLPYLIDGVSVAVINGPDMCVVSGNELSVDKVHERFEQEGIPHRTLHTSHAYHSPMMDPILKPFEDLVRSIAPKRPEIPFLSNVSGIWIKPEEATDPAYWAGHLRSTVRFSDCLSVLLSEESTALLEVGPGRTLASLAQQHPARQPGHTVVASTRHPKEEIPDAQFFFTALGRLWMGGLTIPWERVHEGQTPRRIPLSGYHFIKRRCWITPGEVSVADDSQNQARQHGSESAASEQSSSSILADIWKELLGVDSVLENDSFFDLGGSSMMAAVLFARIERTFGKQLPLSVLYDNPTLSALARLVEHDAPEHAWSCLVPIRPEGTRPPLILVHGAGGNVFLYRELASRLPDEQPVFGLQSQGLDGKAPLLTSVEEMAQRYIYDIEKLFPEGPCMLGGYCLGGSVAMEIAQQFRSKGREVPLLVMFETYDFSKIGEMTPQRNAMLYAQKLEFHLKNFLFLGMRDKLTFLSEKAKVVQQRSGMWSSDLRSMVFGKESESTATGQLLAKAWQTNDDAAYKYLPRSYGGNMVEFLPKKEYAHHKGPALSMGTFAEDRYNRHTLKVYPAGMMVEPFVASLARELDQEIRNAFAQG